MKQFRLSIVFVLAATTLSLAQWQQNPQISTQTGPIYPPNPSYNFSSRANSDPFQFNWYSGQWNYVPIPYNTGEAVQHPQAPYVYNWNGNMPDYSVVKSSPPPIAANPQPPVADKNLWDTPAPESSESVGTQILKFQGRIIAVQAIELSGCPYPHILLRMLSPKGGKGTVDVGEKLVLPEINNTADLQVTAIGKLGMIDGNLVLFADNVAFGNQQAEINRHGGTTQPSN
ncbi:MAG: hypothetical protein ABSF29_13850 [Tepidisphaeraceae bacterium]